MSLFLPFALVGLLLTVDLLLVACRSAYQYATQVRLLNLRESMEKKVNRALAILAESLRLRAGITLILHLVRFSIAGLVIGFVLAYYKSPLSVMGWLVLMLIAWLIFMLEWVMERLVNRNPEIWAIRYGRVARFILAITSWVTVLPLRLMGESNKPGEIANTLTQDDFETLVDTGQEEGLLEREEGRMIISIVRLGETLAREIMVPRIDMVALDVSVKPEQAVDIMLQSGHSRVPVYEDTIDKILGVLYVKDLLRVYCSETRDKSLREIIRPAYFIPEAKHLDTLLAEMQAGRIHMAIVVDEYGGIAGLVTLEDIVEEIVGEIQDEYDQEEELPYQILENGDYLFQGRFDLDAFNEMMGSNLDTEEADTLAGYIYSQLGRVPFVGEKVQHDNLLLTVEQVSARRIRKIRSSWLQPESSSPQGEPIQNEDQKGSSSEPRVIRSMRLSDNDKVEGLEGTHGAY